MSRAKTINRGGRPSKFTTDTAVALAAALGRGKSIEKAAREAKVGASSAYRWVARGRSGDPRFAALTLAADRRKESPFADLFASLGAEF
jgi:hypothetical protein